eukprot:GHRR01002953.1.p1 GENE.GHRR01002953.1~~GHRR01002953.1.p1  ORF type:complete len:371 (+),score=107.71 GHRR01002953.1:255-1367(+)
MRQSASSNQQDLHSLLIKLRPNAPAPLVRLPPGKYRPCKPRRSSCCTPTALKEQPGIIANLIIDNFPAVSGLNPKAQLLVSHGTASLLVPVLTGWLVMTVMHYLANQARLWCEDNPNQSMAIEVVGILPAALEGPTVSTVGFMVAIRLLRNAVWMLDHFVHTFNPTWNNSIDLLLHSLCTYLIPLDRAIVKVYSLVIVGFITTVLVKWKTLAVEFYLLREQERSRLPMANTAGSSGTTIAAASSTEDLERLLVPLDAISSWLAYVIAGLVCAQLLGVDVTPLLAVGGASGIVVGLATQQLLTNAVMGLSLFLTRPFVAGDSVMCQSGQMVLSGNTASAADYGNFLEARQAKRLRLQSVFVVLVLTLECIV